MKNIMNLTAFQIKTNKKQIIGWSISIFAIMFLYMILFPSVQDMAQIKMEAMPEELMQFMGMDDFSDMSNFVSYFGMIYNIILIAISIFAVVLGAGIITKEEKNKTIEFLYALETSRVEIYISKFVTAYIGVLFVVISAIVATILCGFINGGETFILMDVLFIVKGTSVTPFVYLGIGMMVAGISSKVSGASVGSMLVVLSYVLGFLSTMVSDNLSWVKYFSPFEVLNPTDVIELTGDVLMALSGYCGVLAVTVVIGGVVYRKRDYRI